jgi:hypothetical protein
MVLQQALDIGLSSAMRAMSRIPATSPYPPVRRHVSVKDWFRRLGWLGLWLVAQHGIRLWLTDPTFKRLSE